MAKPALKVLWHWSSMGPYHFARMNALARAPGIELTVVEIAASDGHGWIRSEEAKEFTLITLRPDALSRRLLKDTRHDLLRVLNETHPNIVVAAGYRDLYSLRAILAHRASNPNTLTLLWSESTAADRSRARAIEAAKALILKAFDGALVAGKQHAAYLASLGMPAADMQAVGNCVDNDLFARRASPAHADDGAKETPDNYFLFVGRFVPQKNLSRMIEAYREYRQRAGSAAWDLVLVGSGPDEGSLKRQIRESDIEGTWFTGLRQAQDLPAYYARARCFVLPSISEPWGLVVNEAMASGLPVLVSNRCGCVPDLLEDGVNGFVFDPFDTHALATLLFRVSTGAVPLRDIAANARHKVSDYSPALFAERAATHLRSVYESRLRKPVSSRARRSAALLVRVAIDFAGGLSNLPS